jgi:hypothetical protein
MGWAGNGAGGLGEARYRSAEEIDPDQLRELVSDWLGRFPDGTTTRS